MHQTIIQLVFVVLKLGGGVDDSSNTMQCILMEDQDEFWEDDVVIEIVVGTAACLKINKEVEVMKQYH